MHIPRRVIDDMVADVQAEEAARPRYSQMSEQQLRKELNSDTGHREGSLGYHQHCEEQAKLQEELSRRKGDNETARQWGEIATGHHNAARERLYRGYWG